MSDPAYAAALRLLGRRDYFRAELRERLIAKGCEPSEVEAALERCAGLGLIDDGRLAARFVELRAGTRGWGPRRLEAELRRRGVGRGLAERVSRLEGERASEAIATALRRSEVRAPDGWWRIPERRARMVSSLLARGFEASDAIAAVEELAAARESQHHAFDDE